MRNYVYVVLGCFGVYIMMFEKFSTRKQNNWSPTERVKATWFPRSVPRHSVPTPRGQPHHLSRPCLHGAGEGTPTLLKPRHSLILFTEQCPLRTWSIKLPTGSLSYTERCSYTRLWSQTTGAEARNKDLCSPPPPHHSLFGPWGRNSELNRTNSAHLMLISW